MAILIFIFIAGSKELVEKLLQDEKLIKDKNGKQGVEDMKLLMKYVELMGILDKVRLCSY